MKNANEIIAANLRFYRKILDIKQEELAEKIGFTNQTVSRAENGKFSLDFLLAFARYANVSLDTLCGLEHDTLVIDGLTKQQVAQLEKQIHTMREKNK